MDKKPSIQTLGGKARASKLTPGERSNHAKKMVKAREEKRRREKAELEGYRKANAQ